jgi:hypothetical protein
MQGNTVHTFHIPVLGLAFSIDTPLRVARFGISSVVSLVDDVLIERMREQYSNLYGEAYTPIASREPDSRARRITAYLDLIHRTVQKQIADLKASAFESGSELVKYFEMLADHSPLKALYHRMIQTTDREIQTRLQNELRSKIVAGSIDVNIMTKLDKVNPAINGEELPPDSSDALAALRGFAQSSLESSVVLSAGLNPRLFSYLGRCKAFLPDDLGRLKKKVILKVSDFRSALIQGKLLARKGVWVSEYRIESGLNCGGHAFATDGVLLGPILEEFRLNRDALMQELHHVYCEPLREAGRSVPDTPFPVRITVQGGIGTANEDAFLRKHHGVDGTGWGSPFLLVPEATNVDDETRKRLAGARREDYYLSDTSPLGIPFNNLRNSSSEEIKNRRSKEGRPGSPCTKKYLVSNTEFTEKPICTASRQYQELKIKQLRDLDLPPEELENRVEKVVEKTCLCEDLAATALLSHGEPGMNPVHPVAVCPGPNLAYFSRIVSLEQMVSHIYGRTELLTVLDRPHMFINELRLYVDHLKREISKHIEAFGAREQKSLRTFRANLLEGVAYYKSLLPRLVEETEQYREKMRDELLALEAEVLRIMVPGAEA